MPGVVGIVSAGDIAGVNNTETIPVPSSLYEEVFASKSVYWYGQAIALVVAETQQQAKDAAATVVVKYKNVRSPILTIEQAIAANSFYPAPYVPAGPYVVGDVNKAFGSAFVVFTGEISTGSQYHFHMENQAIVVEPNEGGFLTVHTSCQVGATRVKAQERLFCIDCLGRWLCLIDSGLRRRKTKSRASQRFQPTRSMSKSCVLVVRMEARYSYVAHPCRRQSSVITWGSCSLLCCADHSKHSTCVCCCCCCAEIQPARATDYGFE
jgi:hypothetical protein